MGGGTVAADSALAPFGIADLHPPVQPEKLSRAIREADPTPAGA